MSILICIIVWMKTRVLFLSAAVLLFLALVVTYSNHFNNDFHFDDSHTIVTNPYIRNLGNTWAFFTDARTFSSLPANQMYRPLFTLTTAIDYRMANGLNPIAFHITNFVLFLAQLILMFFLFRKIFDLARKHDWNDWLALLAVAWYGLHTAIAETINYISARSDLLSTMLIVLAFYLFCFSARSKKWHLYLIPFALGVLVKPSALVFAPLLFCYSYLFEDGHNKLNRAFLVALPSFALGLLLYILQKQMTPPTFYPSSIPLFNYLITQPFIALYYLKTFFLPFGLSADYDWLPMSNIFNPFFFIGAVFLLALLYSVYYFSKEKVQRPIAFGLLWFLFGLLPSSSFFPLSEVLNDHRVYLPFVGLALAVVWGIGLLAHRYERKLNGRSAFKFLPIIFCLLILLGNAVGTHYRNKVWKGEESLWHDVTIKSPKNGRGLMNYGNTQMAKGNYAAALKYYAAAQNYTPDYPLLHINTAIALNGIGDKKAAEEKFKRALALSPDYYAANYYYARWLSEQGRTNEAVPLLEKADRLSPGYVYSKYLLIDIFSARRQMDKVGALAEQLLAIDPGDTVALKYASTSIKAHPTPESYLNLSLAYYREKRFEDCIGAARQALKLRPDYAEAYNNIGAAYNEMGEWLQAIAALEYALKLKPDFQLARNNLNWAKSKIK